MLVGEIKFCAPDQIRKTKLAEAWYQDLLKFFKNTFESLGFIHVDHTIKQQVNQSH